VSASGEGALTQSRRRNGSAGAAFRQALDDGSKQRQRERLAQAASVFISADNAETMSDRERVYGRMHNLYCTLVRTVQLRREASYAAWRRTAAGSMTASDRPPNQLLRTLDAADFALLEPRLATVELVGEMGVDGALSKQVYCALVAGGARAPASSTTAAVRSKYRIPMR